MAFGNHQRPPDHLSSIFPLTLRGILPLLHAPHTQGCRSGAYMVLYAIMDPIPSFQIKVPKSNTHFEGGFLNSSVWQSEDHSRIPITWPCKSWVGNFIQDYSKGILRGHTSFQSAVKASSISILHGQLN
ncbi:hypothetical protein O181_000749 [Austropuccinia psidii MF-1]|uniref:Uncharacterized protein n=1 Tax=Austropuccinia psidii MF-1 TaxID=1389203 RepID=A0A9Q3GB75_9BASI|nr:hypothetical protein [Austropuccinia psidii MF-1]